MIGRRRFLTQSFLGLTTAAVASGAGQPRRAEDLIGGPSPEFADLERLLEIKDCRIALGEPRSWHLVRQGFHPIAPERVVILQPGPGGWSDRREVARQRPFLVREIHAERQRNPRRKWPAGLSFPLAKLDTIVRVVRTLTDAYRLPHFFRPWARNMAAREDLGSTAWLDHVAAIHDFQLWSGLPWGTGTVPTANGNVDWWLFLFPSGAEWDCCRGGPMYAGLCPVIADSDRFAGCYICVMAFVESLGLALDRTRLVVPLRHLDPVAAARLANLQLVRILRAWVEHRKQSSRLTPHAPAPAAGTSSVGG